MVPTAVEGLGKRTKSREGRKGLGESFHGGLRVRALVRLNTSRACPPPCPGPRAMSQRVLGYQRPQLGSSHPGRSGKPSHPLVRKSHWEERSWSPAAMNLHTGVWKEQQY